MTNPLHTWRTERGLSQKKAGEAIGVSDVTWWRWEQGQSKPAVSLLPRLRQLTGLSGPELRPDIFAPEVWQENGND